MRVLVVNTGSTSVKLRLLGPDDELLEQRDIEATGEEAPTGETARALAGFGPFDAVGHRVVHGGPHHDAPVRVDDRVLERLRALTELAPLHQPRALAGIDMLRDLLPDVPQVACFDTAFHSALPPAAATYALPAAWRARFAPRRYGFHGLSHAYAARRAGELTGIDPGRVVTAHLGAGASLAAVRDGLCADTTMGFTPMEGLVMATRGGDIDPGLVLWLLGEGRLGYDELRDGLEHRSGLAGLAGTGDMREVVARVGAGDADARLALDVYLHRLRAGIAAMAAALGGLDTLVFTGGVGEHNALVRSRAVEGLAFLGVRLDEAANAEARPDADVTAEGARARVLVLAAREDLRIAEEVRAVLGA
ncbi:acetate/propionate family kinase [Actinorugispora endophytica]|uniref:Acetate kinase n=1 Tax=Actinorugispora endophytica TaxID=1605990 RepID=A0A4R6UZJ9_9ACTN|nr:acetate/propionate family kinase [Actinorugispora endophytica]TDQ52904.1 acetate kinase [Actinorugispora endophytica]